MNDNTSDKKECTNINDFKILISFLSKDDATLGKSKITGLTKSDIAKKSKFSVAKVGQVITYFVEIGLLEEGLKKGRAKTFFVTYDGLKKIDEFKESIII